MDLLEGERVEFLVGRVAGRSGMSVGHDVICSTPVSRWVSWTAGSCGLHGC
jgi:hypothetical protein